MPGIQPYLPLGQAADLHLQGRLSGAMVRESIPYFAAQSNVVAPPMVAGGGTALGVLVPVFPGDLISKINWHIGTTLLTVGTVTPSLQSWLADGSGAVQAATAAAATTANVAANTVYTTTLPTAFTVPDNVHGLYAVLGLAAATGTAVPTFVGALITGVAASQLIVMGGTGTDSALIKPAVISNGTYTNAPVAINPAPANVPSAGTTSGIPYVTLT